MQSVPSAENVPRFMNAGNKRGTLSAGKCTHQIEGGFKICIWIFIAESRPRVSDYSESKAQQTQYNPAFILSLCWKFFLIVPFLLSSSDSDSDDNDFDDKEDEPGSSGNTVSVQPMYCACQQGDC